MAFHIPSSQEFVDLKSIMDGLSLTTADDYRVKLHMPFAGNRTLSAVLNNQGDRGFYWSHYPYASNNAYYLSLYSSYVYYDLTAARANAFSVRCFADEYVEPDSTWAVVEGSLGSAGIFHNSTLGLISVTNGSNKNFTIKDKNEGATVVYNDGDTLTQANMGNYYQWGNYYGFPSSGDVSSTSSTRVDTTGYGNGVPYSSSTFITGNDDWSNPSNTNLWAGSSDEYFEREGHTHITVSVYNKAGDTLIHTFDDVYSDSTISTLINSGNIPGVTVLSTTINGTALSTDTVLVDGTSYYDVTPVIPPIPTGTYITKVYHNNQAYNVGGVVVETGESYTAGNGIDITSNKISVDTSTAPYDNTKSGATATNVQDAIDEVFQSVSNGKTLIAAAITDKGVSTAATDSFQTMASNISSLDIATEAQIAAYNMLVSGNGNLVWNTSINYGTNSTPVNASSSFGYTQDEKIFYFIGAKQDSSSDYNRNSGRLYMFNKDGTFDYIEVDIRHNKNNRDYPFSSIAVYQKTGDDNLYFGYVYGSYTYTGYNAYNAYCKYNVVTKELEEIQLTELGRREGDSFSSATWRDGIVVTQLSSGTVTFPYTINVDYTLSTYTGVFVTTQRIP